MTSCILKRCGTYFSGCMEPQVCNPSTKQEGARVNARRSSSVKCKALYLQSDMVFELTPSSLFVWAGFPQRLWHGHDRQRHPTLQPENVLQPAAPCRSASV